MSNAEKPVEFDCAECGCHIVHPGGPLHEFHLCAVTVCLKCGAIHIVTKGRGVRKATPTEEAEIAADPAVIKMRR